MEKEQTKNIETAKLNYIEETGLLFEQSGMTRMAGRIFGYLLISDEDAVSFDRIREILNASKGSISSNIKQLIQVGFIEPVSLPGDRKTYFRLSQINIGDIVKGRLSLMKRFVSVFRKGRELKNREDHVSRWLLESSSFYTWLEEQFEEIITRWDDEKDNYIEQMRKNHED